MYARFPGCMELRIIMGVRGACGGNGSVRDDGTGDMRHGSGANASAFSREPYTPSLNLLKHLHGFHRGFLQTPAPASRYREVAAREPACQLSSFVG